VNEPASSEPAEPSTDAYLATGDEPTLVPPDTLFDDAAAEERWRSRFTAIRLDLPEPARDETDRCLFLSNESGRFELHLWDVRTGAQWQATDRADGTISGTLDPSGRHLWWFDDEEGDEFGSWRRQPFGPRTDAVRALPEADPGYSAGLGLGAGVVLAAFADDDGSRVHRSLDGAPAEVVYQHTADAGVAGLSRDETLWVLSHAEAGDTRYPDLRAYRVDDGSVVAELSDGPGKALHALDFAPVPGDQRLLVGHERRGRDELLIWDLGTDEATELSVDLPGDLEAGFTADGTSLVVLSTAAGRTTLHRYDLATAELTPLSPANGTVTGVVARPDGAVWYRFTSAADPATVRTRQQDSDSVLLQPPGGRPAGSEPLTDLHVPGPGGDIHAFLAVPPGGRPGPHPTVFYVHGGPAAADDDSFDATRATWLDAGFAVVQVNYRGSTGYGSAWRDALTERIGFTELADIDAVHDRLIADGLADPARSAIVGHSWGGYLALLAIGVEPDRWTAAVAGAPVADYVAAYADEMEPLRAYDRALFGGSPETAPDRYRDSSPITYVDAVRTPVLIIAGENDPRTPIRQIENYLAALAEGGHRYRVYRYEAGHGSMVVAERIRQVIAEIGFVRQVFADAGLSAADAAAPAADAG
jgi:dipeptidyl aminopeptidase/acylaminoacyl peptidase